MSRRFFGLDPGMSGAFAAVDEFGTHLFSFGFGGVTEADQFRIIHEWMSGADNQRWFCYLEKVGAMPKQGVSSTFKFGASYGFLRATIIATGISWDEVTPVRWQDKMRCRSGGDKAVPLGRAQQLFPGVRMTKTGKGAIYDALLLAEYARRVSLGLEFN